MKEILIFAGTTEGRNLSEWLCEKKINHTVCVATEYGEIVLKDNPYMTVQRGRMEKRDMENFIQNGNYAAVVDATHPYADVVTANIKQALSNMDIPYLRLLRDRKTDAEYHNIIRFSNSEECASVLETVEGNILLTTGSKELAAFCTREAVKERLFVRVLPSIESISLCMENGIVGKQILALQGPFNRELNEALIRQYDIKCLVTKESGTSGGYEDKIEAAANTGILVYAIRHEMEKDGASFEEVCKKLETIVGTKKGIPEDEPADVCMEIILAGVGMGHPNGLTKDVQDAVASADILLGASRMIADYTPKLEKHSMYLSEEIIPYLEEMQKAAFAHRKVKVVILFSGDTGFYSGCSKLYKELEMQIREGSLQGNVRILPGISSVAYLASCIGECYENAAIYSIHGKEIVNLPKKIRYSAKTFLLLSGVKDINRLGKELTEAGLAGCRVVAGYQLSYPEQIIKELTPGECMEETEEGLYVCFIENPYAENKKLTHGMADDSFIRDKVPMTKEEVREVSICKLRVYENAVVYDVGSGTGSIAVEIAGLSDTVSVYAIEQKEEACLLIEKNMNKSGLENITVIREKAPTGFELLPVPTHAFIGGSSGNMETIIDSLYKKNPHMRVVINAITMETISEVQEIISRYPVADSEVVQMQISHAKTVGKYHLMQAENPVWIFAFSFTKSNEFEESNRGVILDET